MRYPVIAAALKSARLRKGLTQEQVAAQVGTSRFHWIRLEQGLHRPLELGARITEVLGVDEKLLAGDEDEAEAASMKPLAADHQEVLEVLYDAIGDALNRNQRRKVIRAAERARAAK